jgi:quercetin dioxygenase-like cupin family protein
MVLLRLVHAMGRIQRAVLVVIVLAVMVAGAARVGAQQAANRPGGVVVVRAAEIKWEDYPGRPGVKLAVLEGDLSKPGPFLMRVKFPAGFKLAPHIHPSLEHTTILLGGMRLGYGTNPDGPAELMSPGTVIITPANTPHFAVMPTETIVQTHGVGPWSSTPVK